MAGLLEQFQKRLAESQPKVEANQTSAAARSMAAASGTATGPQTPISNIAERVAASGATDKLEQIRQNALNAASNIAQAEKNQEAQQALQRSAVDIQQQGVVQQTEQARQQIAGKQEQAQRELEYKKYAAQAAQRSFDRELTQKQTELRLNAAAARSGIRTANDAAVNSAKQKIANSTELLNKSIGYNELLQEGSMQNRAVLQRMEMAFADKLEQMGMDAARIKQMWEGIGGLVGAGVSAYGDYNKGEFDSGYQEWKDKGHKGSYGAYKNTLPKE